METINPKTIALAVVRYFKDNPMLTVSAIVALVSMAFVRPDAEYLGYFDFHTLLCLWAMLAVLCAFRSIGVFRTLASRLACKFRSSRAVVLVLVMVTFVGSAFLTNDMALLTFLPLAAMLLSACGQAQRIPFVFIMQTLAANLGGMILPFGNPQNLYLFSYYGLNLGEFAAVLAPPFLLSLVMILACCMVGKSELVDVSDEQTPLLPRRRFALLLVLFVLVIAMVFNLVPYWAGWLVVIVVILVVDRESMLHVDYGLLLTFACFFVFAGNLTRVPLVQELMDGILTGDTVFLVSCLVSQFISNVPSAILLAPFTGEWQQLLLGVDIGGLGTPVASLASLITIAELQRCLPGQTGRFLIKFELFNFAFLAILVTFTLAVLL